MSYDYNRGAKKHDSLEVIILVTDYTENIKRIIETGIIDERKRQIQINNSKLYTYWNVGREIVKAQKEDKIKYGNSYVKMLSLELTKLYGPGYDYTNLSRMKKLYLYFPNVGTLTQHFVTWSHLYVILPINDENKRNYYINLVNDNKLSVRQLKEQIKNNAYERLDDEVKDNIVLNKRTSSLDLIKDPLLLDIDKTIMDNLNEKALKKVILEKIEDFLLELGAGFAFIGSEKKIKIGNNYKYIDLLFFNYVDNCFIVIELKINRLTARDIGQLELYVNYIDAEIKKGYYNPTIGVLICKKNDKEALSYFNHPNIKVTTYKNRN